MQINNNTYIQPGMNVDRGIIFISFNTCDSPADVCVRVCDSAD